MAANSKLSRIPFIYRLHGRQHDGTTIEFEIPKSSAQQIFSNRLTLAGNRGARVVSLRRMKWHGLTMVCLTVVTRPALARLRDEQAVANKPGPTIEELIIRGPEQYSGDYLSPYEHCAVQR